MMPTHRMKLCWVFPFIVGAVILHETVLGYPLRSRQRVLHRTFASTGSREPARGTHSRRDQTTKQGKPPVFLLSLKYPQKTAEEFLKTVSDVWKWKDAVLGDGRDYFIPRTKTLGALQTALLSKVQNIDSLVVLSNCARLEILIIGNDEADHAEDNILESISSALLLQVNAYQKMRFRPPPFDWPASITTELRHDSVDSAQIQELARHWTCYATITSALTHWCAVAAGLAERPNRLDRAVEFRPFSSRDAHILLQFKRTVAPHGRARWCVDTALSAGKAARSNDIVQTHRTNDSTRPMPKEIASQVQTQVLEPLISQAVVEWNAKGSGAAIRILRERALDLASSEGERQWIKCTQLHEATMALRRQDDFDVESFLDSLQNDLNGHRSSGSM